MYQTIRQNGGWDNWDMVEVERYCAEDRQDLHCRERFWLEELGATLNVNRMARTEDEKKNDKRKIACEYYQINKEKFVEYRKKNQERIVEYRQTNKEKIATYRQENKEKIAEYKAEYYQENKEKFSEKVKCECGCVVSKGCLTKHRKTIKHNKLMEEK